jgi:diguanylate cyclase (GGDEF)-like protein
MQHGIDEAISNPLRISRRLTTLAALLSVFVALCAPLGYGLILYRYEKASVATDARAAAWEVDAHIAANPSRWRDEGVRLKGIVDRKGIPVDEVPRAQRRQVLAPDGSIVAESVPHDALYPLHVTADWPVREGDRVVGSFTIESSLEEVVEETVQVAILSGLVGLLLFVGLHELPIRAVRKAEADLSFLAQHDPLTHLPNRALFGDRLTQALERAKRTRTKVGLFFMDLDHFKSINDSLGHPVGDGVLVQVVSRLAERIRKSDTMARISGDEFMVIAEGGRRSEDFLELARQLRAGLEQPFVVAGHEIYVTLSGGIAVYPDDADAAAALICNADLAMYEAKQSGRDAFKCFTPALTDEMKRRAAMHLRLRHALEHGEFRLHYQPIHCAHSSRRCGYEALLRWETEPGEVVEPDGFIGSLEETGLIVPVGQWVVEEACRQLARWRDEGRGDLTLSVNVSARQFHDGTLVERIRDCLGEAGVPANRLVVEITESLLLDDEAGAEAQLEELSSLGVGIALDDFGTGYSALNYLQRLPLDVIKIDRSFVAPLTRGDSGANIQIVNAIIDLAHSLDLAVTAEGIETAEQLSILKELGCDRLQGYYFGHPAPVSHHELRIPEGAIAQVGLPVPA